MSRGRQPKSRLTHLKVRQALPGRYCDGRGLRLVVLDRGGRRWRYWSQRLVIRGKRRDLGIGPVDEVSLAEAREMAEKNQKIARRGGDPCGEAAQQKNVTFAQVYEVVTENRSKNWQTPGTGAAWGRMFDQYILPTLGPMLVADITIKDIRDIVEPDWNGRGSKGYLARQNIDARLRLGGREWVSSGQSSGKPQGHPLAREKDRRASSQLAVPRGAGGAGRMARASDKDACQVGGALHDSHSGPPF